VIKKCPNYNVPDFGIGNLTPRRKRDELYQMCENEDIDDISTKIPVTLMPYRLTFRNKYCAECHGYSRPHLHPWDVQIACNNATFGITKPLTMNELFSRILQSAECNIFFYPQEQFSIFEPCNLYISACNISGNWKTYNPVLETACKAYNAPYKNKYKNVFCYMCNAYEMEKETCTGGYGYDGTKVTMSMVLKYDVFEELGVYMTDAEYTATRCPRNAVFDKLQVTMVYYILCKP
jgi:hypothetical protein